jgi:hypothetical protein
MIIRGPYQVSPVADVNGNFRAMHRDVSGFVGYGRTPEEAKENLVRNAHDGKRASANEELEAKSLITLKSSTAA